VKSEEFGDKKTLKTIENRFAVIENGMKWAENGMKMEKPR